MPVHKLFHLQVRLQSIYCPACWRLILKEGVQLRKLCSMNSSLGLRVVTMLKPVSSQFLKWKATKLLPYFCPS